MGTAWKMDHETVLKMAREGKTRKEIAEAFGVTRQAVSHALKPFGIPRARHGRLPAAWVEEAVRLAKEGMPAAKIAEAVGRSAVRVRRVLSDLGVQYTVRTDEAAKEEALGLRRQGMKYAEIATLTGLSASLVAKVCMDAAEAGEEGLVTSRRRPRRKFGDADREVILRLAKLGRTQSEIAEATGWSQPTVSKVAREG